MQSWRTAAPNREHVSADMVTVIEHRWESAACRVNCAPVATVVTGSVFYGVVRSGQTHDQSCWSAATIRPRDAYFARSSRRVRFNGRRQPSTDLKTVTSYEKPCRTLTEGGDGDGL